MMYQMRHNLINFDTDKYLIQHTETRTHRSHPLKYQIPKATKDVFKFSYLPRTIKKWNKLPEDIVLSNSLDVFKGAMPRSARLPSYCTFLFWIRNPKSKKNKVEEILDNLLFSYWLLVVWMIIFEIELVSLMTI